MAFIYLDTETNNNEEDRKILQLAFIVQRLDNDMSFINEKYKIDEPLDIEAMVVHGITPDDIVDLSYFVEGKGLESLELFNLNVNYLIAHNAEFDIGALKNQGFDNKMQVIDTLKLLKAIYPDEKRHKLGYFFYKFELWKEKDIIKRITGKDRVSPHDAMSDCAMLYLVFHKVIKETRTIEEIMDIMEKPLYDKYFTFGKYSRYRLENPPTIEEVVRDDRKYVEYILDKFDDMIPSQRESLEHWYNEIDPGLIDIFSV